MSYSGIFFILIIKVGTDRLALTRIAPTNLLFTRRIYNHLSFFNSDKIEKGMLIIIERYDIISIIFPCGSLKIVPWNRQELRNYSSV